MNKFKLILVLILLLLSKQAEAFSSGEVITDKSEIVEVRVVRILSEVPQTVANRYSGEVDQKIEAEILEGVNNGKMVTIENDYFRLDEGEIFYAIHNIRGEDGVESYGISGPYRLPAIYFLSILFVVLVVIIGGIQGVRGLLSLLGSLILIIYLLLPQILAGHSPLLVSICVSSLIIVIGSYVTHGFNKTTNSAVLGMIVTVIITGMIALWSVHFAKLTGYSSEEVSYLVLNSQGKLGIIGVLLGGFMIGVLGLLYDIAISQAIVVEELHKIAPHIEKNKIYFRAIRVGREHIGALVNTLAIAYVGAALPILLLFMEFDTSLRELVNREIFATEIIRILVGSIGLVLAVPITTLFAVTMLVKNANKTDSNDLESESKILDDFVHRH